MKTLAQIKKITAPIFALLLIFSCNNSEKKEGPKKENTSTEAKKDTKADLPAPAKKGTAQQWNANAAKAQVNFSVSGPFGMVHGSLSGLKSDIRFDKNDLANSSINASVDARTIATGVKLRNSDIQKEKYLDTDNHPSMSFTSDKIERSGNGYKAIGKLTIKGVAKAQEIPFSFTENGNGGVFKGSFTIQRKDYGVGPSGGSIGNSISIDLEVPVTK